MRTQLVDIVDDNRGKVFSTTIGSLQIARPRDGPKKAKWIARKKTTDLAIVTGMTALNLVYGELGVYDGLETGTLCSLAEAAAP